MPTKPKQTSKKKIKANRKNAKKSTGPKTAAGKVRSSRNAEKYGLFSNMISPREEAYETQKQFDRLTEMFYNDFQPQSGIEYVLVERLIVITIRLRRLQIIETDAFEFEMSKRNAVALIREEDHNRLQRYEIMLNRQFHQTIKEIRQFKTERKIEQADRYLQAAIGRSISNEQPAGKKLTGRKPATGKSNGPAKKAKLQNEPKPFDNTPNPLKYNRLSREIKKQSEPRRPKPARHKFEALDAYHRNLARIPLEIGDIIKRTYPRKIVPNKDNPKPTESTEEKEPETQKPENNDKPECLKSAKTAEQKHTSRPEPAEPWYEDIERGSKWDSLFP